MRSEPSTDDSPLSQRRVRQTARMSQRRSSAKLSLGPAPRTSIREQTRVYSAAIRLGGVLEMLLFLYMTLTALADSTSGPTAGSSRLLAVSIDLALIAAEVALMVRAGRRGLLVRGDVLISRGWLRTRAFPLESITLVETAPYERVAMPGVAYDFERVVIAVIDGERHDFRQVRGLKRSTNRRADRLRQAVGLGTSVTESRP